MSATELRTIDQILALADGGDFLSDLLEQHQQLMLDMVNHRLEYGGKSSGSVAINIKYELSKHGDLRMTATHDIKAPKPPAASGVAWMTDNGHLTPENPRQMKLGVRDVNGVREFTNPGEAAE